MNSTSSAGDSDNASGQGVSRYAYSAGRTFPYRVTWAVLRYQFVRAGHLWAFPTLSVLLVLMVVLLVLGWLSTMPLYAALAAVAAYYVIVRPSILFVQFLRRLGPMNPPGEYRTVFDETAFRIQKPDGTASIPFSDFVTVEERYGFVIAERASRPEHHVIFPRQVFPSEEVSRVREEIVKRSNDANA